MTEAHLKLANGEQCLKTQTVQSVKHGSCDCVTDPSLTTGPGIKHILNPLCLFPSWPQKCLAKPAEGVDANSSSESTVEKQL